MPAGAGQAGDVPGGGAPFEIHARYRGRGYVVTTRPGEDERVVVEVTGCDRDGQVVLEVGGQVPVEDLEVVARLLAGAARLHQPAPTGPLTPEDDDAPSGGTYRMRVDGRAYTVEDKRGQHPNAYQPWDEQQEQELIRLHQAGMSIGELSEELGRNPGGIRARLIKLGILPSPGSVSARVEA